MFVHVTKTAEVEVGHTAGELGVLRVVVVVHFGQRAETRLNEEGLEAVVSTEDHVGGESVADHHRPLGVDVGVD